MCRTISPRPRVHCFNFLQVRLFWKAPTSSSHQNLIGGYLLTPILRCPGRESGSKNATNIGSNILGTLRPKCLGVLRRNVPCYVACIFRNPPGNMSLIW